MTKVNFQDVKKLREETGAGVMEVKEILEKHGGDYEKAKTDLMSKVASKAAKKADREIKDGLVHAYIHSGGKVGSLVLMGCETDFVAKTDEFQKLIHEVALQVCTDEYESVEALMESDYIRDPNKKIKELVQEVIAKVGENIEIRKYTKFSISD